MGMSLAGHGALAIWHDIIPEGRDDFYAWHGREHMPERLGIPGFLRGRRYVAIDAALEFFNLYEAQSVEVLKGQDYSNRVNNPTPWTLRTTTHFRHVARSLCQVKATHGHGHGGLMATLRYDVQPDSLATHVGTITQQFLPKAASRKLKASWPMCARTASPAAWQAWPQHARCGFGPARIKL
jgi:hypothetical protein